MIKLVFVFLAVFGATTVHADFKSTAQELAAILSDSQVKQELEKAGDLWTIHRIQSGDRFGYQIVTSGGCTMSALIVESNVRLYPKVCQ